MTNATSFTETNVPLDGIETTVDELIELYGGELKGSEEGRRTFVLPLRRGLGSSGGVECTLRWSADTAASATVTLTCDRDLDAPKLQRVLMLGAGVAGALLFMSWPFLPKTPRYETLAWIGAAIAIAVYFLSLRKSSGGLAADFLGRLVRRQRSISSEE